MEPESSCRESLKTVYPIRHESNEKVIALAGNPNTGKSTLFNHLTGLKQHTGNWPGKTVIQATGHFRYADQPFTLIDLPGTYSLLAKSVEEEVARNFICFAQPDVTVVVADAGCLERNLNLVLQIMEITPRMAVCVNLMDEARRKNISVDTTRLSRELGVPVVGTAARKGEGIPELLEIIHKIAWGILQPRPKTICYPEAVEKAVAHLQPLLAEILDKKISPRWVALRLLDGDESLLEALEENLYPDIVRELEVRLKNELQLGTL